jgi:hypothetical protein
MGVEPPEELHRTNITTAVAGDDVLRLRLAAEPAATTATTASYFARLGAAPLERSAGSMHRVGRSAITRCDAGATTDGLVLWVEAADGVGLAVESVVLESGATPVTRDIPGGRVVIPWEALGAGAGPGTIVRLRVVARDTARRIVETVPADGLARRVELPGVSASAAVWTA